MTAALVVCWVSTCLATIVAELRWSTRGRRDLTDAARVSDEMLQLATLFALLGPLAVMFVIPEQSELARLLVGGPVAVVGVVVRSLAMRHLRGRYRLSAVDQHGVGGLRTTGVYALVRHPGYLGLLLSFLGLAVLAGGFTGPLWVLPMAYGVIQRIRVEERILMAEFGTGYDEYRRVVPAAVLPGLL